MFRITSVTNRVVAIVVMRLVDAGKLDPDGDLGALLGSHRASR